jgi:hypothetical protein
MFWPGREVVLGLGGPLLPRISSVVATQFSLSLDTDKMSVAISPLWVVKTGRDRLCLHGRRAERHLPLLPLTISWSVPFLFFQRALQRDGR